jgi:ATP/ADP translocase
VLCRAQADLRLGSRLASVTESFALIARSAYLRHVCGFLVLNYSVSAFFYFEKTLVVAAAAGDAASRTALFASINSASAFFIIFVQAGPLWVEAQEMYSVTALEGTSGG